MPCFSIMSHQKLGKFLGKIRTVFGEIDPQLRFWLFAKLIKCKKNPEATLACILFSKAFDSIHRRMMEQIPLTYSCRTSLWQKLFLWEDSQRNNFCHNDVLQEYESNGSFIQCDTDFIDIITEVFQGNTLAPYLFIICFDYIHQTSIDLMKETDFTLKKRQEADDILSKLSCIQTTQMI